MHTRISKTLLLPFIAVLFGALAQQAAGQSVITTIAGNGSIGFSGDGGPATSASLGLPNGVTIDSAGNVYIVDALNRRIRKVDTGGKITTFAGNGLPLLSGDGGPAASAGLALIGTVNHLGVVADASGNVYISDYGDNRGRKVSPAGIITTFAGKVRSEHLHSRATGDLL